MPKIHVKNGCIPYASGIRACNMRLTHIDYRCYRLQVLQYVHAICTSYNALQNLDVNRVSLLNTIDIGTPCRRTISDTYNFASCNKERFTRIARKCADFVNRSTITHTVSFFLLVLGNPVMKSMVTCSHFHTGISRGSRVPPGF